MTEEEQELINETNLRDDQFYMPFVEYLFWFKGTVISLDQQTRMGRNEYEISSIGADMTSKKDMFVEFTPTEDIDCSKQVFSVICE